MATGTGVLRGRGARNSHQQARTHTCSICQKTFKRSEHCLRHERGHTKEKPFSCEFCGRRYARKDLVSRHEKSFHPLGGAERHLNDPTQATTSPSTDLSPDSHQQSKEVRGSEFSTADVVVEDELPETEADQGALPRYRTQPESTNTNSQSIVGLQDIIEDSATFDSLHEVPEVMPLQTNTRDLRRVSQIASNSTQFLEGGHLYDNSRITTTGFRNSLSEMSPRGVERRNSRVENVSAVSVGEFSKAPIDKTWQNTNIFEKLSPRAAERFNRIQHQEFFQSQMGLENDGFEVIDRTFTTGVASNLTHPMNIDLQDVNFFSIFSDNSTNLDMDFSMSNDMFQLSYDPANETDLPQAMWEDNRLIFPPHRSTSSTSPPDHIATKKTPEAYASLPHVDGRKSVNIDVPVIDEATRTALILDMQNRLPTELFQQFNIPSALNLQKFIASYLTCFHHHFPILHLPSMDMTRPYAPLFLGVCAIGALYRLRRILAKELWSYAQVMVEPELHRTNLTTPSPTRAVQARLLLTIFAVFNGDVSDVVASTEKLGFWSTEYRLRRAALAFQSPGANRPLWYEWVDREISKRLLCGIFIMSSLLTVTYDINAFVSVTQDLNVEMPEPESTWQAKTSEDWERIYDVQSITNRPTVRDVMAYLIFENGDPPKGISINDGSIWGGFATTVVMHAVNINMWHVMQCTQSFTGFPIHDGTLGQAMVLQVDQALGRCYSLLTEHQSEIDESTDSGEGPLLFNCQALLRSAYVRLFTGAGSFDRMILLYENEDQVRSSINAYVQSPQVRNIFMTTAVSKAYGGLLTPITAGYLLVRKTAALSWSVEHAIAAWDCALFVTKWIHGVETRQSIPNGPPDAAESENLANFCALLSEVDSVYDGTGSLAAEIAIVWAGFMDDTWVWGITPRMGHILRLLSKAYSENWSKRFGSN